MFISQKRLFPMGFAAIILCSGCNQSPMPPAQAPAAHVPPSKSIGGLTLGTKPTFPECIREARHAGHPDYEFLGWDYDAGNEVPCWNNETLDPYTAKLPPLGGKMPVDARVAAYLQVPVDVSPEGKVTLIRGRIEGVRLTTKPYANTDETRKYLQAKWGTPTIREKNGTTRWSFDGFYLDFEAPDADKVPSKGWTISLNSTVERNNKPSAEYDRAHSF